MQNSALYALGSGIVAIPAVVYYVSPAATAQAEVPPILVEASAHDVIAQIEKMSALDIVHQMNPQSPKGDEDIFKQIVRESISRDGNNTITFNYRLFGDDVLVVKAIVESLPSGQTSVDVNAELPDSRFSTSEQLHPYDRKAVGIFTEVIATEYVTSVLKRQRMANGAELGPEIKRRLGFSMIQGSAFFSRCTEALKLAYQGEAERFVASLQSRSGSYSDHEGGDPDFDYEKAAAAEAEYRDSREQSSSSHRYENAAEAAADAADAARTAAESAGAIGSR